MSSPIIKILLDSNEMKLIRVIFHDTCESSLRRIAALCKMSPSTASDVLSQLVSKNVLYKKNNGRRTKYELALSSHDKEILNYLFNESEKSILSTSAKELSHSALKKISWIDETLSEIHTTKLKMT